jgi:hypothetical protein
MNGLKKRTATTAVVLALAAATMAIGATPASAVTAPVFYPATPGAACYTYGVGASYTVYTPTIYAVDFNAGGGNDWQWVHFRSRIVSVATGQTLQTGGWSAWSAAYDNFPAQYSGAQTISTGNYQTRVAIDIEWWSHTQALAHGTILIQSYRAFAFLSGAWQQAGVQSNC